MPKQHETPDDFIRKMAGTFRAAKPQTRRLTQQSGDAGNQGGQKFVNPMTTEGDLIVGGESGALTRLGIGTDGQVLTVQPDGSLAWSDPTGGGVGGQYRQYVVISDGAGGFDFVDDGTGNPVYTLEDLE